MDYGSAAVPVDQIKFVKDVTTVATQCTLVAHLDDFRTLGAMDLKWNYAAAIQSRTIALGHTPCMP